MNCEGAGLAGESTSARGHPQASAGAHLPSKSRPGVLGRHGRPSRTCSDVKKPWARELQVQHPLVQDRIQDKIHVFAVLSRRQIRRVRVGVGTGWTDRPGRAGTPLSESSFSHVIGFRDCARSCLTYSKMKINKIKKYDTNRIQYKYKQKQNEPNHISNE